MTLPPSTDPRWLPRSPYCLSSEGESRLAVDRYFVLLPDLRGLSSILGSGSPGTRPCRIHTPPQHRTSVRMTDCTDSSRIGKALAAPLTARDPRTRQARSNGRSV